MMSQQLAFAVTPTKLLARDIFVRPVVFEVGSMRDFATTPAWTAIGTVASLQSVTRVGHKGVLSVALRVVMPTAFILQYGSPPDTSANALATATGRGAL